MTAVLRGWIKARARRDAETDEGEGRKGRIALGGNVGRGEKGNKGFKKGRIALRGMKEVGKREIKG